MNLIILSVYYLNTHKSNSISWDTLFALAGVLIAVFAIFITIRLQTINLIESQLIEIAKTCNSYLVGDYQIHNEDGIIKRGRASGIVTALEDSQKIIDHYCHLWRFLFSCDKKNLKKYFFNHLHSSIKELLKGGVPNFVYWKIAVKNKYPEIEEKEIYDPIRHDQLTKAREFFKIQIQETADFNRQREIRLGINS